MLIVGQGGNAINLKVVSILGVDKNIEEDFVGWQVIADVQRNFIDTGSLAVDMESVFFYRFCLGRYEVREEAQKVLEDLILAYERGLKVYRVPAQEEKFNVDSQC